MDAQQLFNLVVKRRKLPSGQAAIDISITGKSTAFDLASLMAEVSGGTLADELRGVVAAAVENHLNCKLRALREAQELSSRHSTVGPVLSLNSQDSGEERAKSVLPRVSANGSERKS